MGKQRRFIFLLIWQSLWLVDWRKGNKRYAVLKAKRFKRDQAA